MDTRIYYITTSLSACKRCGRYEIGVREVFLYKCYPYRNIISACESDLCTPPMWLSENYIKLSEDKFFEHIIVNILKGVEYTQSAKNKVKEYLNRGRIGARSR